jgi:hypothetical protein
MERIIRNIDTFRRQNVKLLTVKAGSTYICHLALMGYSYTNLF